MALKTAILTQVNDLLDEALPRFVPRMSLAGKHKLHGALPVVRQADDALELLEDERGTLVSGKPPGEANGQRVVAEQ